MIRRALLSFVFAALAVPVFAQVQPITGYTLKVYNVANMSSPVTTFPFQASDVTCNLVIADPAATVTNPSMVIWDDPTDSSRRCRWTDPGTGPLFAMPFSLTTTYRVRMSATNSAGTSPDSADSLNSFTRPGTVPASPARVRVGGSGS